MIPILDWIFEGIVGWIASIVSQLFDAVSGLFLEALGTDMTAMEEYFPFVTKAYDIMQVTAWAILILIVVWQLFRAFGGPITEAENPWHLLIRGAIFAFLIGYAKPIFTACLSIARAPYTSLMDVTMTGEDFTFAGIEQALTSGLTTLVSVASVVGLILILILEIALGWNYFKLLLETVERYIVVGVLCYTSPLAFSVGGSKATNTVFRSWCRMVGSQLLLLVMNVWFLRGFASSMGQFIANGGALSTGKGSIFLWMFCALAYLKCAQRFDSYLASIGLNVAQTGSSMGMELLMAARVLTGAGSGARSAGSVFSRGGSAATGTGAAASGFAAGFASKFSPNSYVRDAVVDGGIRMGFGGGAGFVARAFGGIAARNGATLNGDSISSVASRSPNASGMIAGDIADRSLSNYMPHMKGFQMQGTQITGGHISTTATTPDGKKASVDMFNASQYEKPDAPHSVVTASDGSQWYQMASGEGRGAFYDAPVFGGMDAQQANAANVHTETPAANDGESVGAQMHDNEQAEPANIVTGADGMPQAVGAFPGDQAHAELSNDGLTENPGIIPGASDMPGLDVQQPAAVEGAFNEAGGPVSIGPDGMPMDGSAIRGDQTPAEFGAESLTENAGVVPGVSEMPGMAAEQSVGMEGGIHESGAPVTIGSESEGMPQAVGSFPGDQMPAEGLENLSESSGVIPGVSEMPGMEGGLNEVPASFGGEEMAPNTITGFPADQMPAEEIARKLRLQKDRIDEVIMNAGKRLQDPVLKDTYMKGLQWRVTREKQDAYIAGYRKGYAHGIKGVEATEGNHGNAFTDVFFDLPGHNHPVAFLEPSEEVYNAMYITGIHEVKQLLDTDDRNLMTEFRLAQSEVNELAELLKKKGYSCSLTRARNDISISFWPENLLIAGLTETSAYHLLCYAPADLKESFEFVRKMVLNSKDEEILMLFYDLGFSYQDISEELGISITAVHERMINALRKLRDPKYFNLIRYGLKTTIREMIRLESECGFQDGFNRGIEERWEDIDEETGEMNVPKSLLKCMSGIKIEDLHLSIRVNNCLRRNKVETLVELVQLQDKDLLAMNNLGNAALKDIRRKQSEYIKNLLVEMVADEVAVLRTREEDCPNLGGAV